MRRTGAGYPACEAVLACAVAGLAGLMLTGCGSARLTNAAAARVVSGLVPGSPVPASAIPRLRAVADQYVQGDSLTAPQWVSVVATSHKKALAAATPVEESVTGIGNIAVYLMTLKGRFSPLPVPSPLPSGKGPLSGKYLSIVVDAKTFEVLYLGLGNSPPPVSPASLGPVTYLAQMASPPPAHDTGQGPGTCQPSQVRLAAGPRVSEATQQHTLLLVIRNISTASCALRGYPGIALLTDGVRLPFSHRDGGDQMLTSRPPTVVIVPPRADAYVAINKNACVTFTRQIATRLELRLPGDLAALSLTLPRYPMLDYCAPSDPGHTIDITPVEPSAARIYPGR